MAFIMLFFVICAFFLCGPGFGLTILAITLAAGIGVLCPPVFFPLLGIIFLLCLLVSQWHLRHTQRRLPRQSARHRRAAKPRLQHSSRSHMAAKRVIHN